MKKVSNSIVEILKIFLSLINFILAIVIILNILLLLSSKVLKNTYPTILDYTFYVVEEKNSSLNLDKGSLLIIDTRTTADAEDIIVYQNNNKLDYAKVTESDNYSATIKDNGNDIKIGNGAILGIVKVNIPEAGIILNKVLTIPGLIVSIIVITITSIFQSLINKKQKRDNQAKPDFANMKNI